MTGGNPDTAFVFWYRSSPPTQYHAGLNYLSNVDKPYIHYSVACKNAYYNCGTDTCICDAHLDAYQDQATVSPVGSAANISHTRWSWGPGCSITLQTEFYRTLFSTEYFGPAPPEPGVDRLGVAHALSKCAENVNWYYWVMRWCCYATNLFGSPTTDAWTKKPSRVIVTHPTSIPEGDETEFTVTVKDGNTFPPAPLAFAKVCLHKPNDIYEVEYTNSSGQYTFTITPQSEGYLRVTVTRLHNFNSQYKQFLPYRDSCEVTSGDGVQEAQGDLILPTELCITNLATISMNKLQLEYGIPHKHPIEITLYDVSGREQKMIKKEKQKPGYYSILIDTRDLSAGVYFIVLRHDNERISRKCILLN